MEEYACKFNGVEELRVMSTEPKSGEEIWGELDTYEQVKFGKSEASQDGLLGKGTKHNYTKKPIFGELPYWRHHLVRHCMDMMHTEYNVFNNTWNTVMNVIGKTKDHSKARRDLEYVGLRPEYHLQVGATGKTVMPPAKFTLSDKSQALVYTWLSKLKVPDSYSSNIARTVNLKSHVMMGMKSHDCRVMMGIFMPLALRHLLPEDIWEPICKLSNFFRIITSKVITKSKLVELQEQIVVILCQLEMIFPPSWFDSMEHVLVHVAYETRVAGPVQYRWMYPFERCMNRLKRSIKNRAKPEGSIALAYIAEEIVTFCSRYLDDDVETKLNRLGRNDDVCLTDETSKLSVFRITGRRMGKYKHKKLQSDELKAAAIYVLFNCEEVTPFFEEYEDMCKAHNPNIEETELRKKMFDTFQTWFQERLLKEDVKSLPKYEELLFLAKGPLDLTRSYKKYCVNGFRFHTTEVEATCATQNSGVRIKGAFYEGNAQDYYGVLQDVIQLEYLGAEGYSNYIYLFKCHWYDTENCLRHVPELKIAEVQTTSKLGANEPFVLASQALQVFYIPVLAKNGPKKDWHYAIPHIARNTYDMPNPATRPDDEEVYQEEGNISDSNSE